MTFLRYVFLSLVLIFPQAADAAGKIKVAFVHQGTVDTPGWAYQHDLARKAAEKFFGDKIEATTVDNLQPGPDAERVIIGLARNNNSIIFITSPELTPAVEEAAKRFPDIYFEIAQGKITGENISTYDGRFYEARYILGQLAAKISESGTIGYIATKPEPDTIRNINAFLLGAQNINPGIKLDIVYAGNRHDAGDEAAATRAIINAGADVLSYQTFTPAPAQIAEQNGVPVFGDASDMITFAPQQQIAAVLHDWSGYYIRRITSVLEGKWVPVHVWAGIREGAVGLTEFRNVDDQIRAMAIQTRQKLIDDKLKIFMGPLFDRDGKQRLKKDEAAGDAALRAMDWYVKGDIKIIEINQ